MTVTEKYRLLGSCFREKGAELVILMSSGRREDNKGYVLAVAVDRVSNPEGMKEELQRDFPEDEISLEFVTEQLIAEKYQEYMEEGIRL